MSKIKVEVGDKVKCGDIIGLIGSTGTSTSPHLHYEVLQAKTKKDGSIVKRKNGKIKYKKINPLPFILKDHNV